MDENLVKRRFHKWIENGFNTGTADEEIDILIYEFDLSRKDAEKLSLDQGVAELIQNCLIRKLESDDYKFPEELEN